MSHNTRRLMAKHGLSYDDVVEASGLDARTIRGMVNGQKQPHAKTVQRLADAFGVSTEELFLAPTGMTPEAFDAATNPQVQKVHDAQPDLFDGWTPEDFAELSSRFGVGGSLSFEGVVEEVRQLNHNRRLLDRARIVLESREAPLLASLIELLFERITTDLQ